MSKYTDALIEFHREIFKKTGYWPADVNQKFIPRNETARLREYLHAEEGEEAAKILLGDDVDCSLAHLLKELCDMQYVLSGTIAVYGLDKVFDEAFDRVHANNLLKLVNGTVSEVGKFIKPKDHPVVNLDDLVVSIALPVEELAS